MIGVQTGAGLIGHADFDQIFGDWLGGCALLGEAGRELQSFFALDAAPTKPGACVTAMASTVSREHSASASARSVTGTTDVRCSRDAISGTTPPKSRCTSCERITSERRVAAADGPSTTAADVSSQELSMPRTRRPSGPSAALFIAA